MNFVFLHPSPLPPITFLMIRPLPTCGAFHKGVTKTLWFYTCYMYLFSVLIGLLNFLVPLSNNLGFDDDDDDNDRVVCKDNRPVTSHKQFKLVFKMLNEDRIRLIDDRLILNCLWLAVAHSHRIESLFNKLHCVWLALRPLLLCSLDEDIGRRHKWCKGNTQAGEHFSW